MRAAPQLGVPLADSPTKTVYRAGDARSQLLGHAATAPTAAGVSAVVHGDATTGARVVKQAGGQQWS